MKLKLIAIILFSLILNEGKVQFRYNLTYEPQLGQNFVAENLNADFHLLDYVDSLAVEKRIIKTKTFMDLHFN